MTVYLHYIGHGLYSPKRFMNESKRYGVNRAIAFNLLSGMKWGDVILLAQHVKEEKPTAVAFGYFTTTTLTFNLPEEVKREINTTLEEKGYIIRETGGNGSPVERACGSYMITSMFFISDRLFLS